MWMFTIFGNIPVGPAYSCWAKELATRSYQCHKRTCDMNIHFILSSQLFLCATELRQSSLHRQQASREGLQRRWTTKVLRALLYPLCDDKHLLLVHYFSVDYKQASTPFNRYVRRRCGRRCASCCGELFRPTHDPFQQEATKRRVGRRIATPLV